MHPFVTRLSSLLLFFLGPSLREASGAPARGLSDAQIADVRTGGERRMEEFFRSQSGTLLKRAAIKPDWNKRGDYTRDYGHSIVLFAMRALELNEQLPEANAALAELCQYHLDRPQTLLEVHSFPSVTDALARMCVFYGPRGSKVAGRLSAETYAVILKTMWAWVSAKSELAQAEVKESQTWWLEHSENHHAQHFSTCWSFSKLLKDESEYRDRKYTDGHSAREHYEAWTIYLREYLRQRAAKGMLIEIDSPSYASATLKGIYSLYDFSEDVVLKRRAGQFLELYWALWAEQQIDGVSGGAKTRTYAESAQRGTDFIRRAAWYALGMGDPRFVHASMLPFVTTTWQMPDIVIDLALNAGDPTTYEVRQRRIGLAARDYDKPPHYRITPGVAGILRYSYRTPEFVMSSLLLEARPERDWAAISAQNRWMGVIFRGATDARVYPYGANLKGESVNNAHWAVQAKGTLIAQKLRTSRRVDEWRVWFSKDGLSAPVRGGRWTFAEAAGAFVAVCVAQGEFEWSDESGAKGGRSLKCGDDFSPVIIEAAAKSAFASFEAFRTAILARPVEVTGGVLNYTGLGGDMFRFPLDQSRLPEINGEPINLAPARVYDSPFVQSVWNSGVVTLQKGARKTVLDFNR
ncbi:MAG: hypothetical protein Q8N18_22150 [Opitutaceae bacterium]|nr:hypothetical protein [Opitutaceae bacterium]